MGQYSETILQIEQILNLLMSEDAIRRRRTASAAYLGSILDERISKKIKQVSLGTAELSAFAVGEKPLYASVTRRLTELGISREKRSELRTVACVNPKAAEKQLRMYLYDRELAAVFKESRLGHTSWRAFLESTGYTTPQTAKRIARAANMTPAETREFLELLVRDSFEELSRLRPALRELMARKNISEALLKRRTLLSSRAWAPLARERGDAGDAKPENEPGEKTENETGEKTKDDAPKERVSQSTLLRLAVGLELDRPDAEALLGTVGSGFIMRRDLVVLAALMAGIYQSWDVYDILETYAQGPYGERYYGNIYQSRCVVG